YNHKIKHDERGPLAHSSSIPPRAFHFLERFEFLADIKGGPTRFSPSKIRDLPDFIACVFGLCLGIILADWTLILMKVLLADDRQGHRDSLRRLIQRDPEVQVSGIAEDAEKDRKSTRLNSSHLGISYAVF